MWIHQRVGQNTGVTVGAGTLLFLAIAVAVPAVAVFRVAWPVLLPALACGLVWAIIRWMIRNRAVRADCAFHDREHIDGVVDDACHWCHLDLLWLQDRERQELEAAAERAEARRLRERYRNV